MSFFYDFKYLELVRPKKHARRENVVRVRSACLNEVVNTFFNNVARTNSFCWFPAHVAAQAIRDQLCRDYAVFKVTGKLNLRKASYDERTEKAIWMESRKQKRRMTQKGAGDDERRLKIGVPYIRDLLSHEFGTQQSMLNILFSVVVESWTAFETLAADLWYVALDHGSEEWRKRSGLKYDKPRVSDSEPPASIDLDTIADPQKNYGSFLRDTEKVSFQKLSNIVSAYKTTFGKDEIKNLFEKYSYIFALSAVRNVITHKAGVADRKYVDAVKPFPELNGVAQGTSMRIDGEIVRKLRKAAIIVGNELVLFVDERISRLRLGKKL
jgi:hypothetical protein